MQFQRQLLFGNRGCWGNKLFGMIGAPNRLRPCTAKGATARPNRDASDRWAPTAPPPNFMPTTAPGAAQNADASGINDMTIRATALCAQRRCADIRAFIERCASLPAAILI